MSFPLTIALLLAAATSPANAQIDVIRLAPPTGIYVETAPGATGERCDWYASASDLLAATPTEREATPLDCELVIRLRGVLNQPGAARFAALTGLLAASGSVPARIVLNSHGGDAVAAFRIAATIRGDALYRRASGGVSTAIDVADNAICFSACLIVFAAGYQRSAEFSDAGANDAPVSRLGMHSPAHFDRTISSYDTAHDNRNIQIVRHRLIEYFRSVDVSEQIVDDMFSVPFDRIHRITRAEAIRYRLIAAGPQEQHTGGN